MPVRIRPWPQWRRSCREGSASLWVGDASGREPHRVTPRRGSPKRRSTPTYTFQGQLPLSPNILGRADVASRVDRSRPGRNHKVAKSSHPVASPNCPPPAPRRCSVPGTVIAEAAGHGAHEAGQDVRLDGQGSAPSGLDLGDKGVEAVLAASENGDRGPVFRQARAVA